MRLLLLALGLLLALPAAGVIHDLPDGDANIGTPTPHDPGWAHVGLMGDFTGVYLGNRWVLTVRHVGPSDMVFGGVTYPWIPGSRVRFQNPDLTYVDVQVFRLASEPNLPMLPIGRTTPDPGTELFMAGQGRNRGAANGWQSPSCGLFPGYDWASGRTLRWGRNVVEDPAAHPGMGQNPGNTVAFFTDFDQTGTDEAQAAKGDSGGAVFAKRDGRWELAGLMYTTATYTCETTPQADKTSLYGNFTYIVDLAEYREWILDTILECRNGVDDDGDGAVDHPADSGCFGPDDPRESLEVPAISSLAVGGASAAILVAARLLFGRSWKFPAKSPARWQPRRRLVTRPEDLG